MTMGVGAGVRTGCSVGRYIPPAPHRHPLLPRRAVLHPWRANRGCRRSLRRNSTAVPGRRTIPCGTVRWWFAPMKPFRPPRARLNRDQEPKPSSPSKTCRSRVAAQPPAEPRPTRSAPSQCRRVPRAACLTPRSHRIFPVGQCTIASAAESFENRQAGGILRIVQSFGGPRVSSDFDVKTQRSRERESRVQVVSRPLDFTRPCTVECGRLVRDPSPGNHSACGRRGFPYGPMRH